MKTENDIVREDDREHGRYTILLVALMALLIVPPLLPAGPFAHTIVNTVFSIVAIGAAFNVSRHRATIIFVTVIALATLAARGVSAVWPEIPVGEVVSEIFAIILFGLALRGVAREIFHAKTVTTGTIRGAICVYILMGIIWAVFYSLVETAHPGSFAYPEVVRVSAQTDEPSPPGFFYYSFVTMTTLGYGDITPRAQLARTLSWLETLAGQLFMTITLAQLVSVHVSSSAKDHSETSSPPDQE